MTTPELRHYHGQTWHAHDGGNVPHDHAFGKAGYVQEGLSESVPGFVKALLIIVAVIVGAFLAKWAYTKNHITTHWTTVLGTRVCQSDVPHQPSQTALVHAWGFFIQHKVSTTT